MAPEPPVLSDHLRMAVKQYLSEEEILEEHFGGRRPFDTLHDGQQMFVIIGDDLYGSKYWSTPADFLYEFVLLHFGEEWLNNELQYHPSRHPIAEWIRHYHDTPAESSPTPGIEYLPYSGAAYCLLGLAYNLYLIQRNSKLSKRLINRLRNVAEFQGAYYETIVCNFLLRAGFSVEFENEDDNTDSHCELTAISKDGRVFSVEAKMRSEVGVLGKTDASGSRRTDPTSRIIRHIKQGLAKSGRGERLLFIDVNDIVESAESPGRPKWLEKANRRLHAKRRDLRKEQRAYVFITNMSFHRSLATINPAREAMLCALGVRNFQISQASSFPEMYTQKSLHGDVLDIFSRISSYPGAPDTFDGIPATHLYFKSRFFIGKEIDVTLKPSRTVTAKILHILPLPFSTRIRITASIDSEHVLQFNETLTPQEYRDFAIYGLVYFGYTKDKAPRHPLERYSEIVQSNKSLSRSELFLKIENHENVSFKLREMSDDDLLLHYSEILLQIELSGDNEIKVE